MNDYAFGTYIYEQRRKRGLSQTELADLLGVTNKAVSKWENGRSKPTTDTLRKLAAVLGTRVEELLKIREERRPMDITKIVVTGGPCAGKTTGMSWIQNAFASRGYRVLFVPETATELITAWTGHPHLRVIGNDRDFDGKMKKLISEIAALLGEPEPFEIERKFLIEYPDIAWLESLPNCHKVDIIQTYLLAPSGDEVRVRQRGENGSYTYYQTTKRTVTGVRRVEIERRLTQREYLTLLMEADPSMHPIRKTRYCLTWEEQYFEIDVYPFWDDQAIVEIELSDEDTPIRFPKELKVIREVTDDDSFKNASLARR